MRINSIDSDIMKKGPYAGDVSALALLSWPEEGPHNRSDNGGLNEAEASAFECDKRTRPTLLVGMGSQLLWYDLLSSQLLLNQSVLDGVRVHGIHTGSSHTTSPSAPPLSLPIQSATRSPSTDFLHIQTAGSAIPPLSELRTETLSPPLSIQQRKDAARALLAVFGEKRVKVLEVWGSAFTQDCGGVAGVDVLRVLPRFSSWVFDAKLLPLESSPTGLLAVGLGNNSVRLWDWRTSIELRTVACTSECLLYSMALHGDSLADLAVVAGTIYNEVLVWKVDSPNTQGCEKALSTSSPPPSTSRAEPIHTLRGHEGSIHRVCWSPDGSKVMSVSDDRSARVWNLAPGQPGAEATAGPVLYGHTARIWDCLVHDRFIVTASEDCTCRIWTPDGALASVVRGHTGRGIWRVVFEPRLCALVTGGADSAVKLHPLSDTLGGLGNTENGSAAEESFVLRNGPESLVKTGGGKKEITSKSEFVRCLAVVGPNCVYVATNRGYLYRVDLDGDRDTWHPLIDPEKEPGGPIVSLAVRVQRHNAEATVGATSEGEVGGAESLSTSDSVNGLECAQTGSCRATNSAGFVGEGSPFVSKRGKREASGGEVHNILWGDYRGRATAAYYSFSDGFEARSSSQRDGGSLHSALNRGHDASDIRTGQQIRSEAGSASGAADEKQETAELGSVSQKSESVGASQPSTAETDSARREVQEVLRIEWQAHELRNLLGVFWADSLGYECAFTTNATGGISWWRVASVNTGAGVGGAVLLGRCQSPFWIRVVCLMVDEERENLLCGDQKGNLAAFALPPPLEGDHEALDLQLTGALKAAHGISAIPLVTFPSGTTSGSRDRTVTTVGRDGCICTHLLQPPPELETGRKVHGGPLAPGTTAVTHGVLETQKLKEASLETGEAATGRGEMSVENEKVETLESTKLLGEPLSDGVEMKRAGGFVSGSIREPKHSSDDVKISAPLTPNRNGVNEATTVESTVWLTCTRVERVSAIPSIEWTGFFGTDPPLTRTLHRLSPLETAPTQYSQTVTPQISQPLPERRRGSSETVINPRRLAAGFSATEFIVWDLEQQSEVIKVTCGGWHRPHSFWIGRPGGRHVSTYFAYVKDDVIHVFRKGCVGPSESASISRQAIPAEGAESGLLNLAANVERGSELLASPKGLQSAFHGRELHTAKFLPGPRGPGRCVVTGGEDGTVRITRFLDTNGRRSLSSAVLGEHVRGAAIRTCAVVAPRNKTLQTPKANRRSPPTSSGASRLGGEESGDQGDPPGPCVVFTAGAKEVLTAWLHAWEPETGPSAKGPVSGGLAGNGLCEGSDVGGPVRDRGERGVKLGTADNDKTGPSESQGDDAGGINRSGERWAHSWRWLSTHDESREAVENRVRTANTSNTRALEASETGVQVRGVSSGPETEPPSSTPSSSPENTVPSADASPVSVPAVPSSDGLLALRTASPSSDSSRASKTGLPSPDASQGSVEVNSLPDRNGSANPPSTPKASNSKAGPRRKWAEKDDQRYLAVTAFSTGSFADGSMTCFVVTASADSRLVLRAFHPASRTWHLLARLEHHKCPVLSLDWVSHPTSTLLQSTADKYPAQSTVLNSSKDALGFPSDPLSNGPQSGNDRKTKIWKLFTRSEEAILVVSGATDGSLAFWDVSEPVQSFCSTWQERVAAVSVRGGNSRPPTGRGSAGGGGVRRLTGPRMSKRRKTKMAKAAASALGGRTDGTIDGLELGLGESETGGEFDTVDGEEAVNGLAEESLCQEGGERKITDGFGEDSGELPERLEDAEGGCVGGNEAGHRTPGNGESALELAPTPEAPVTSSSREAREGLKSPSLPGGLRNGADKGGADGPEVQSSAPIHTVASLAPVLIVDGAHQSGVNGLSVAAVSADVSDAPADVRGSGRYVAVSGGDDQAIHTVYFWVGVNAHGAVEVRLDGKRSLPLAHSSAVKDIWTDGSYAFSTGLDQRLRCWRLEAARSSPQKRPATYPPGAAPGISPSPSLSNGHGPHGSSVDGNPTDGYSDGQLVEVSACVTDVPEAAALTVERTARGSYAVAVGGRGLQFLEDGSEDGSEESFQETTEDETNEEVQEEEDEKDYRRAILAAVNSVERPGSFVVKGSLELYAPPGLVLPELGLVSLPLISQQAEAIAKLCFQAPFGRREATVYDPEVRKCLQLSPDQFQLTNFRWDAQVRSIAGGDIRRDLGLPEKVSVVPELYKLLLYEVGSHFVPHRDTEKSEGMFGTLVVVLPSAHSGGELIVRHADKESMFDSGKQSLHCVHYCAFFADCEHEIRPLNEGYRLALVYDLVAQNTAQILTPADNRTAVQHILGAVEAWGEDEEGPDKLVMPLAHKYCTKSLAFGSLKGTDIVTVETILQALDASVGSTETSFQVSLGMLKKREYGFTDIIVDETEVLPEDALRHYAWDHYDVEEATGNEGASMDRWYHHAALVLWPHAKYWKVKCANDLEGAVEKAVRLAGDIKDLPPESEETKDMERALDALCQAGADLGPSQATDVARFIIEHGVAEMAEILMGTLPISSAADVTVFLGSHFGWASLEAAVTGVFERACTPSSLALCFDLLLRIAPSTGSAADVVTGEHSDQAPVNPKAGQPLKPRSPSELGATPREPVYQQPVGATVLQPPGGEAAVEDASDSCVESADDEGSARERADMCARIVPLLVATICKGLPRATARPYSYSAPTKFCLTDVATASAYARVLDRFGADAWQPATPILIKEQIGFAFAAVPEMLSQLVGVESRGPSQAELTAPGKMSPGATILCQNLASAFVAELLADLPAFPNPSGYGGYGYIHSADRSSTFVTASLKALHCLAVEPSVLDQVAAHFVANPKSYCIDNALLPAIRQLSDWLGHAAPHTSWFVTLWRACVNALEARAAARPAEPRTWALPALCGCPCSQCRQLTEFCRNPVRTTIKLPVAKPIKKHVQNSIESHKLPLQIVGGFDGGFGNPLVVQKNGSRGAPDEEALEKYPAQKAAYERDVKTLLELRALSGAVMQERTPNTLLQSKNLNGQKNEQHVDKRARVVIDLGDE
ncbi:hypothetical protein KFL_006700010 [Klebsormidium nitens]|uniref:Uncharacterized protein n=1 Tax=Klebsormidium nitens TaxID=105231 RepID=A0A1Y1IIX6_KLENI|nr:hypothetical protein KFL_006700010 [Klebsormidium nitens]|eukprot:GAQ90663.1 hypothetical protein KFL_006700010 [Klebsormidium nitens]